MISYDLTEIKSNILSEIIQEKQEKNIDRETVKQAAMDAAKDIFDTPNEKIIDNMISNAIKKAKDTEDAIQIVINMMRSE